MFEKGDCQEEDCIKKFFPPISGFQTQIIPVELNVTGCPLVFQMSRDKDKTTVVRFGTHLEGGPSVVRNLKINNTSCSGECSVDGAVCPFDT